MKPLDSLALAKTFPTENELGNLGYGPFSELSEPLSATASGPAISSSPTASNRQSEIRKRMMELQQILEASEHQGDSRNTDGGGAHDAAQLRKHIKILTEENARLSSMASPPAYEGASGFPLPQRD